jgi:hypothetical protein
VEQRKTLDAARDNFLFARDSGTIHRCNSEIRPRALGVHSLAMRQMPDHGHEPWRPFER